MKDDPLTDPRDRHIRVDGLGADLKQRAARSGAFVLVAQAGVAVVGALAVAVLARLLRPDDFGLLAMAFPLLVVSMVLQNFGLDLAAIQRETLDHPLVSALFWLSLKFNVLLGLGLAAAAPVLVWFYGEPRLFAVTLTLAGGFLLLSLGAQHETLLKRQMRFDVLAFSLFAATLTGGLAAVLLASRGAGYWALVAQLVVTCFVRSLLAWMFCGWRPDRPQWPAGAPHELLKSMRAYGRNLTGVRLLGLTATFADRVTVGWLAGPAVLGFYETGRRVAFLPTNLLLVPLFDVAVAGFSRAGADDARYRAYAARATQTVLALILPAIALLFVEARAATLLVLGAQWTEAVPFARILAVAAFAQSFARLLTWFYLSRNRTGLQIRWVAMNTTAVLAAIALGAWLGGPRGVAIGVAGITCLLAVPAILFALHGFPFSAVDFARAAARPVVLSFGAAAALLWIESLAGWSWSPLLGCIVAAATYGTIYATGWIVTPGGRAAGYQMMRLLLRQ